MKYRLLKDLPGVKKGVIFKEDFSLGSFVNSGDDNFDYKVQYQEETLRNNPDWFEAMDGNNIKIKLPEMSETMESVRTWVKEITNAVNTLLEKENETKHNN